MNDIELVKNFDYGIIEEKIAELKEKYTGLVINGIEDKTGYDKIHDARMDIKNRRVAVEKRRKAFSQLKTQIDKNAALLTQKLYEIEKPLEDEESRIDKIKEDLKRQVQERVNELLKYGVHLEFAQVKKLSDAEYGIELANAKEAWEIQQNKIAIGNARVQKYHAIETVCRFEDVVEQTEEDFAAEYEAAELAYKKAKEERLHLVWMKRLAAFDFAADVTGWTQSDFDREIFIAELGYNRKNDLIALGVYLGQSSKDLANMPEQEWLELRLKSVGAKITNKDEQIPYDISVPETVENTFSTAHDIVVNVDTTREITDNDRFIRLATDIESICLPEMEDGRNSAIVDQVGKYLRELAAKVRAKCE